jgi:hypothetical protein
MELAQKYFYLNRDQQEKSLRHRYEKCEFRKLKNIRTERLTVSQK